jgi:hypothetical protein
MTRLRPSNAKKIILLIICVAITNCINSQAALADSGPTIAITSPATNSAQKGTVTISGIAKPDPAGSAHIVQVGIDIVGLSTPLGFRTREIILVGENSLSSQSSWSFGDAGTAVGVWIPPSDPQGKFDLSFDTTSWPNQTYKVTLFA